MKKLIKVKPKYIFILYKNWGKGFINDFFNELFEDSYEKKETISEVDVFKGNKKTSPVISVFKQRGSDKNMKFYIESQVL
jgi:hypothetical protein